LALYGNMIHPYIRRSRDKEKVTYVLPPLKAILEEALGVVLF
jgi:DNA polymerase III alpha subunit